MTQFKSFALGQGRFIRDQVFAEAARGNMKPLAYFAGIYPVAGEIVGDVKALVREKDRDQQGLARLWSDMMMVGGIGLASDTLTAMRWGRGPDFILGPTAGDFFQFTTNLVNGNSEAIVRQVTRQPAFTATRFIYAAGSLTTENLVKYAELMSEEETPENKTVSIGVHRRIKKESR
jgi:hypothetical protein